MQLKPVKRTLQVLKNALAKAAPTRKLLELAEGEHPRVWLDYFNLRQCGNDFKPAAVVDLIKQIGVCFIEFDTDPTAYLSRTFCALEAFAAVKGDVKTGVIIDEVHAGMVNEMLEAKPVQVRACELAARQHGASRDLISHAHALTPTLSPQHTHAAPSPHAQVAKAQTRRKKDKDMIDAFIVESVGFEAVDAALTKLAIEGAQAVRERALSTMRIIRLTNCALDASCVPSICELLKGAKTLQALDIRGNRFDEASATTIASTALERTVSLCGYMRRSRSDLVQQSGEGPVRFVPEADCSGVDLIFAISDCRVAASELKHLVSVRSAITAL